MEMHTIANNKDLERMLKENQDVTNMLEDKEQLIQSLECEISEFTQNVEDNMITVGKHEGIINQEIENLQQKH